MDETGRGPALGSAVDQEPAGVLGLLGARLDAVVRSVQTAAAVAALDDRMSRWRRERKLGKGTLRPTRVTPYRGYVVDGVAQIRLRVTETPPALDVDATRPQLAVLRANLRRFVALPLAGVRVRVQVPDAGGEIGTVIDSDRRGYATARLSVPGLEPGWHELRVETIPDDPSERAVSISGQVLAPDPAAPFTVVSDIDDTVLQTGLTQGFVAVQRTMLGEAATRRPVPGMAALYQALAGVSDPSPPFWYLSTGAWALYDMLTEFLSLQGFPDGPLFLTDWGPHHRYLLRSGREHKRARLRRLLETVPGTPFVLVGDSGQGDAELYVETARAHPGRVAAIIVLDVGAHRVERAVELDSWAEGLADEGITFDFVTDAAEAARVLVRQGLLPMDAVTGVTAAMAQDGAG